VATGRSAVAARISAATGKAAIGPGAVAGRAAAIDRSAATGQAATVTSAATGRAAATVTSAAIDRSVPPGQAAATVTSAAIGRSAPTGQAAATVTSAAIGRSAPKARPAATVTSAAIGRSAPTDKAVDGRAAVAGLRAPGGLATTVLRTAGAVRRALAPIGSRDTTGLQAAEVVPHGLATKGRRAAGEVVLTTAAGQPAQAGMGQAADRAVPAALAPRGGRTPVTAIAELPESIHAGPGLTRCRWTYPRASPRTS
jgi:hypothetical protein